jgi:hypothetical protein
MLVLDFIKNNPDWEAKIADKPYCITVKRKDNFAILKYSQIDSDFNNPMVRECRGLIIDTQKMIPVCVPFYKFGNYGEGYVPDIDWNTARVQEKVDGSLIKVWCYNGEWHVSTNGMIDAKEAMLASDISTVFSFSDLFISARAKSNLDFSTLDPNFTYMFELVSPYNRVVVPYTETKIYHIGTRDMRTLKEIEIDIGVEKPKHYPLNTLQDCLNATSRMPFNEEGYVVVDGNWNRVKIKSPAYVAAHHLKNNGVITKSRIVAVLRQNEQDEFLSYYPEYQEAFSEVEEKINLFVSDMEGAKDELKNISNRKEFALLATKTKCPAFLFAWLDGNAKDTKEWLYSQSDDKIIKIIY